MKNAATALLVREKKQEYETLLREFYELFLKAQKKIIVD